MTIIIIIIIAVVGQSHIAPTQMIANVFCLVLPLCLLEGDAGLLYIIDPSRLRPYNTCIAYPDDGALLVPNKVIGEASVLKTYVRHDQTMLTVFVSRY